MDLEPSLNSNPVEQEPLTAKEKSERTMTAIPLTQEAFAPYGNVLSAAGTPDRIINRGRCGLYHDRAELNFDGNAPGISILLAEPRAIPYQLNMVEKDLVGSQTYIPINTGPFLVMVAPKDGYRPGRPVAFISDGTQAVNYRPGVWRSVLTPLKRPGLFARVQAIGEDEHLEEHWFEKPYFVVL